MGIEKWVGKIYVGDCREILKQMPPECVDLVIYSPPYYGLRDYSEKAITVWGGDKNCDHEWVDKRTKWPNASGGMGYKQDTVRGSHFVDYHDRTTTSSICLKCGAWRGQLGLEPDWRMYIQHLVEINRLVKRVLKKTGSLYIVIGDTYAGSHCGRGDKTLFQNFRRAKVAESMYQKHLLKKKLWVINLSV